jgi:hypothetical protein
MKTHKLLFTLTAGLFVAAQSSTAAPLLDDDFNDGDLTTNPGIGGAFVLNQNAATPAGSVTEASSQAQITDGAGLDNNNTTGIRSSNNFDLSDDTLTYTATWDVASWISSTVAPTTPDQRRVRFILQQTTGFLFGADALYLEIDAGGDSAALNYWDGGLSSVSATGLGSFDGDADGFTVTMTLDSSGFSVSTLGLDGVTSQIAISDDWSALGTDFATVTESNLYVAANIQDRGTFTDTSAGSELNIDRVTLTAVPEPGSLALLGLGGLLIARRRRG